MKKIEISPIESWFVSLWKEKKLHAIFMILGVIMGAFFQWDLVEIFIFFIFLWSIMEKVPSRMLAIPALIFLCATPLLLVFEREDQAEAYAVYAYYFLVMAVIRAVSELREDEKMKV
ncbi:MAG: hypothetical protein IPN70_05020 [Candidatus Moraniibacteriota bacterium]|nr:MAG: hypothetical protein IPN70_05020 [Candidatus Moranbacteria bacterium]